MQVGSYFQAMKAANERIQELEKAAFEICQCIDRDQAPASYDRLLALCEPRASSQAASDDVVERAIAHAERYDTPTDTDPRRRYTRAQMETAIRVAAIPPAGGVEELEAEIERLNQLALDGVNLGVATGIELCAEWLVKNITRLGGDNVAGVSAAMLARDIRAALNTSASPRGG